MAGLIEKEGNELLALNKKDLDKESLELLNQIIAEGDQSKAKDLTHLFNANQNKKTMIRINKLNELMDVIADQTITRFQQRPDEVSNQELLQGLKVVQDIVERGQKQISGANEAPLIQINTQENKFNLGEDTEEARESRERVKNAVLDILNNLNTAKQETVIDAQLDTEQSTETTEETN